MDYVKKPEDRAMECDSGHGERCRPVAAPPGIPAGLAKILRTAFDATMKDAGLSPRWAHRA
jgi:hypothetical protein